jgi:hypothetical protein
VVAPKEKRLSARIRKSVTIQRHPEVYCCPVEAFLSYHRRHGYRPCVWPHPVLPSTNIHYLLRDIRDCHQPIHWQRIGKYIFNDESSAQGTLARSGEGTRTRSNPCTP